MREISGSELLNAPVCSPARGQLCLPACWCWAGSMRALELNQNSKVKAKQWAKGYILAQELKSTIELRGTHQSKDISLPHNVQSSEQLYYAVEVQLFLLSAACDSPSTPAQHIQEDWNGGKYDGNYILPSLLLPASSPSSSTPPYYPSHYAVTTGEKTSSL